MSEVSAKGSIQRLRLRVYPLSISKDCETTKTEMIKCSRRRHRPVKLVNLRDERGYSTLFVVEVVFSSALSASVDATANQSRVRFWASFKFGAAGQRIVQVVDQPRLQQDSKTLLANKKRGGNLKQ